MAKRSKNETLLCRWLRQSYPLLVVLNNDKHLIPGYEVDVVLPELKLGIEWNGITHHQPIYGKDKLNEVQTRDRRRAEIATESGVHLIVVTDPGAYNPHFVKEQLEQLWVIIDALLSAPSCD